MGGSASATPHQEREEEETHHCCLESIIMRANKPSVELGKNEKTQPAAKTVSTVAGSSFPPIGGAATTNAVAPANAASAPLFKTIDAKLQQQQQQQQQQQSSLKTDPLTGVSLERKKPVTLSRRHVPLEDTGRNERFYAMDVDVSAPQLWKPFPVCVEVWSHRNAREPTDVFWTVAMGNLTVVGMKLSISKERGLSDDYFQLFYNDIQMHESHKLYQYGIHLLPRQDCFLELRMLKVPIPRQAISEYESCLRDEIIIMRSNFIKLQKDFTCPVTTASAAASAAAATAASPSEVNVDVLASQGWLPKEEVQKLNMRLHHQSVTLTSMHVSYAALQQNYTTIAGKYDDLIVKYDKLQQTVRNLQGDRTSAVSDALQTSFNVNTLNTLDGFPDASRLCDTYRTLMRGQRINLVEKLDEVLVKDISTDDFDSEAFVGELIFLADEFAEKLWLKAMHTFQAAIQETLFAVTDRSLANFTGLQGAIAAFCRKHDNLLGPNSNLWKQTLAESSHLLAFVKSSAEEKVILDTTDNKEVNSKVKHQTLTGTNGALKDAKVVNSTDNQKTQEMGIARVRSALSVKRSDQLEKLAYSFFETMCKFAWRMRLCVPVLKFGGRRLNLPFQAKISSANANCVTTLRLATEKGLTVVNRICCFPPLWKITNDNPIEHRSEADVIGEVIIDVKSSSSATGSTTTTTTTTTGPQQQQQPPPPPLVVCKPPSDNSLVACTPAKPSLSAAAPIYLVTSGVVANGGACTTAKPPLSAAAHVHLVTSGLVANVGPKSIGKSSITHDLLADDDVACWSSHLA